MSVDVFTYVINIYVEYVSNKGEALSSEMKLFLYAGVPLFSVLALTAVTIWIVLESLDVIFNPPSSGSVDVVFMFGFAAVNLLIDIISVLLFYRNYDTALYQQTISKRSTSFAAVLRTPSKSACNSRGNSIVRFPSQDHLSQIDESSYRVSSQEGQPLHADTDDRGRLLSRLVFHQVDDVTAEYNLNMWSAASHVSADTLRTFAVFAGALASTVGVNSTVADAWAALICSATIMFALIPLCKEIAIAIMRYLDKEKLEDEKAALRKSLLVVDEEVTVPLT